MRRAGWLVKSCKSSVAAQVLARQYVSRLICGCPVTLALEMFAIAPAAGKANLSTAQESLLVGKAAGPPSDISLKKRNRIRASSYSETNVPRP